MPSALSTPNIALIKYWGNRDEALRLPKADSLSITLDSPRVEATVEPSGAFTIESFDAAGMRQPQSKQSIDRLMNHWRLSREYAHSINAELPSSVSVVIRSGVPQAIGIASSAAVFSCLAEAYAALASRPLTRQEVSIIARLGSGSAARSVLGGFVALKNVKSDAFDGAVAQQIADEKHWLLHDIVIVPSREEKKVGSTEGHAMAATSPLFDARIKAIPNRMEECTDAIRTKDFEKLQRVSEEDALEMHRVMETQSPPLHYLNDETHRLLKEIESLRRNQHIEALYTMDAGPTVHVICTEEARKAIEEFAEAQKGCVIFKTKIGAGSRQL